MSEVLGVRQAFSDLDYWPVQRAGINPQGWLEQFDGPDKPLAEALLSSFVFFNQRLTEQLFVSAFMSISAQSFLSDSLPERWWSQFRQYALVSFPGEEDSGPAFSGHRFAQIARDVLGVPEKNMVSPHDLVRRIHAGDKNRPVLILDDFLGSGEQFLRMWANEVLVGKDMMSLRDVTNSRDSPVYFVVAVATSEGITQLVDDAPRVRVFAGHKLQARMSLSHPDTILVPDNLRPGLSAFVTKYSTRAGIATGRFWGHGEFTTALAFEHGTPDNTLPLFWHHSPNWVSLRRSGSGS